MSATEYHQHSSRLNARAKAEHEAWIKGMTPEERKRAEKLGVLEPTEDSYEVGGHSPFQSSDIAESPLAKVEVDYAGEMDGEAGVIADLFGVSVEKAEKILLWHQSQVDSATQTHEADLLSVVVGGLLSSGNIKISAAGLAFASNMAAANGLGNPATYARSLGVSRSILSKAVKGWRRQLNLRPSPWQKSDAACATYSAVAKEKHWRKAKTTAIELMSRLNAIRKKNT